MPFVSEQRAARIEEQGGEVMTSRDLDGEILYYVPGREGTFTCGLCHREFPVNQEGDKDICISCYLAERQT